MSDSEIETDSSDWSYQGTTEEEESEGDDVFSVDEVVAATGVDFGKFLIRTKKLPLLTLMCYNYRRFAELGRISTNGG